MNSVIEAQEEYQNFHYYPQVLAPGLRVTHHPGYYRSEWSKRMWDRIEAEEDAKWQKENDRLVEKQKGEIWDQKLRNE